MKILNKKMAVLGFGLTTLLFISVACKATEKAPLPQDEKAVKEEIIVGMELQYPPFETVTPSGEPDGISVELAKAFGEYLGRPVKIVDMSYDGLIPALQSAKVDMILSSMTITDTRLELVDFSEPYAKIGLAMLIAKDSKVNSKEDLGMEGITVAVKQGTTGHLYMTKNYPNTKLNVFPETSTCILETSQGTADVFIYDQMSIYEAWKQNEAATRANLESLSEENWGIAIRKDDAGLKSELNAFIEKGKGDGLFDQLGSKYLTDMKKTFTDLNIPFFF